MLLLIRLSFTTRSIILSMKTFYKELKKNHVDAVYVDKYINIYIT